MGQHGAKGSCSTGLQAVWGVLQKTNKKYPDTQFSAFLSSGWTTGFSLGLHIIEEDKWQSGEETTAVVENENQYFCSWPDGKRSEQGQLMTITHRNTQTLQQGTWSSEVLCLQESALCGVRSVKIHRIHETVSQWENGVPAGWFCLLFYFCIWSKLQEGWYQFLHSQIQSKKHPGWFKPKILGEELIWRVLFYCLYW